jgi:O-methyltransferase involved in polyketide biosynthesis
LRFACKAKFTWGIKNGKALCELLSGFDFIEDRSLTEGMGKFVPVYKFLGKIPAVRSISNKITVLKRN